MRIQTAHLEEACRITDQNPGLQIIPYFGRNILLNHCDPKVADRMIQSFYKGGEVCLDEAIPVFSAYWVLAPIWIAYGKRLPWVSFEVYDELTRNEPSGVWDRYYEWFRKGSWLWWEFIEHPLKNSKRSTAHIAAGRISRPFLHQIMVAETPGEFISQLPSTRENK